MPRSFKFERDPSARQAGIFFMFLGIIFGGVTFYMFTLSYFSPIALAAALVFLGLGLFSIITGKIIKP